MPPNDIVSFMDIGSGTAIAVYFGSDAEKPDVQNPLRQHLACAGPARVRRLVRSGSPREADQRGGQGPPRADDQLGGPAAAAAPHEGDDEAPVDRPDGEAGRGSPEADADPERAPG